MKWWVLRGGKLKNWLRQGLFLKVRACVQFCRKKEHKMLKRAKNSKIFENLGKNVQNLKIWKYFEKGQVSIITRNKLLE